jgi:hypothetical protein
MQLLDPQYPSIVEQGHQPSSAAGSVDVTGELSKINRLRGMRQRHRSWS